MQETKAILSVESSSVEHREAASDFEEESGPSTLVHESLLNGGAKSNQCTSAPKEKYAPPNESEEQRNLRTIFVGNLSSKVVQKRISRRILANDT